MWGTTATLLSTALCSGQQSLVLPGPWDHGAVSASVITQPHPVPLGSSRNVSGDPNQAGPHINCIFKYLLSQKSHSQGPRISTEQSCLEHTIQSTVCLLGISTSSCPNQNSGLPNLGTFHWQLLFPFGPCLPSTHPVKILGRCDSCCYTISSLLPHILIVYNMHYLHITILNSYIMC